MADPRCTIRLEGTAPAAYWQAIAVTASGEVSQLDLGVAAGIDAALYACAEARPDRIVVRELFDGTTYLGVAGVTDEDDPRSIVDRLVQAGDPTIAGLPDRILDSWRDRLLADPPAAGTQHWVRQAATLRGRPRTAGPPANGVLRRRPLPAAIGDQLDRVARSGESALRAHAASRWATVAHRVDGHPVQAMSVLVDRRSREALLRVLGRTRRWVTITVPVDPGSSLADLERAADASCQAAERWQELLPADHPPGSVALDVVTWPTWTVGPVAAEIVAATGWLEAPVPALRLVREPYGWVLEQQAPPDLDPAVDAWLELLQVEQRDRAIADLSLTNSDSGRTGGSSRSLDGFSADLDAWRRERPEDPAIVDAAGTLTVADLWAASGRIADQLRIGDVVGIRCRRDRSFAIAVVGCLRARACFVPVDGRADDDRLERADVGVIVEGATVVRPDRRSEGVASGHAYAMATSGSMGSQKVALVPPQLLAGAIDRVSRLLGIRAGDRYLHLAAFGFSSSIRQLLVPLANRATVLVCDDTTRTDPVSLLEWLDEVGPTVLDLTPTMLDALSATDRQLHGGVRTIVCASERLDPAVVRRFREAQRFTGPVLECYGATETSGLVAAGIDGGVGTGGAALAGLDGCDLHVLDRYLHPVPPGMIGELWVSVGDAPAGYLGASTTAAAFLPAPDGDGTRMFRTGDVVRRTEGDGISWIGRADDVVKVRGERVSLLQVSAAAEAHPAVHRAHTALVGGSVGLGAAVERGLDLELTSLQHQLRDADLGAGLPTRIVMFDSLPVNESGKVDRGALIRAIAAGGDQRAPVAEPRTDAERRLLAIWAELFPGRKLGIEDDFFDVGGHSLKAAQLTNRIRQAFERPDICVIDVFEHPTIRTMAQFLDRAEGVQ